MRDTWYGDNRDLIKWGTLAHIAQRESLDIIIQVPYLRLGTRSPLQSESGPIEIETAVWNFFRNVPAVEKLGTELGRRGVVITDEFHPLRRRVYRSLVEERLAGLPHPKLVLLDPDTGIAPSTATAKHVNAEDVQSVWQSLRPGDWLVVYQHAARNATWLQDARDRLASLCGTAAIEVFNSPGIAWDVAFLAVGKAQSLSKKVPQR